ncbi:hypothetical protein BASA62_007003 [Batrachochytrium salamandrivorans]|nr:hypothetical protein BASA62_007003 [Batrachochytrium salamandrivorans]
MKKKPGPRRNFGLDPSRLTCQALAPEQTTQTRAGFGSVFVRRISINADPFALWRGSLRFLLRLFPNSPDPLQSYAPLVHDTPRRVLRLYPLRSNGLVAPPVYDFAQGWRSSHCRSIP